MSDTPQKSSGKHPREREMESAATSIVETLQQAGHIAYFAGGCVRDLVMGRPPHDFDVATSARPEQVVKLFRRTRQVGAAFGVVLVNVKKLAVEVATFRTDHEYTDGRHPTGVTFSSPEEDAQRRDFTINGMFYDPIRREIIDHVGGRPDIAARLIRAIGEPERRFTEDHLRLMRAVRFAGRFDFDIEPETWAAMIRHAADIRRISPERVRMELELMLASPDRAKAVDRLHRSGILRHLWPQADAIVTCIEPAIQRLVALPEAASFELAFAAMLADLKPDVARAALLALHASNQSIVRVCWLLNHQRDFDDPARLDMADLKFLMASPGFDDLTNLAAARIAAESAPTDALEEIKCRSRAIRPEDVSPAPMVDGNDLKAMGLQPGPIYKRILDQIYRAQLNGELNSRESGLSMASRLSAHPPAG